MSQEELIRKIDKAISDLVYDKTQFMKAYNYYNCRRDPDQFRHLEMNYGLGTPTQIEFIPLVRKHVDALVGEYTSVSTKPKISCKDENTLSNIMRDKQLKIKSEVFNFYKQKLSNDLIRAFSMDPQKPLEVDPTIEAQLKKLTEELEVNFVSEYEMAGQHIISHILQSKTHRFDMQKTKMARDMYITGTTYFKVRPNKREDDFEIEVLNPLHTFIDRNPNYDELNKSYRSVIRRYMNKTEILREYGDDLSASAIKEIKEMDAAASTTANTYYIRANTIDGTPRTNGVVAGMEVMPGLPRDKAEVSTNYNLIEVLEVEWIEVEKEGDEFITNLYEGVRINGNIYTKMGKSENMIRSISDPTNTTLNVNGLFFGDRNGEPFSLVLATANLQD